MAYLSLNTPLGALTLFEEDGAVIALEFGRVPDGETPTPVLRAAKAQLDEYFDGKRTTFDLPLAATGTPFQTAVWQAMARIPYGETRTYGDLAKALHSAPRAVGGACGANPLPILVPCHRVLGADGRLGGYSGGDGPDTKRALLRLEGALP